MHRHQQLMDLRNKLGYKNYEEGLCQPYALKAVEAWLGGEKTYSESLGREQYIISHSTDDIAEGVSAAQKKLSDYQRLETPNFVPNEDQQLLDIRAYFDSELYMTPWEHADIFGTVLSQLDVDKISPLMISKTLEAKGGLTAKYELKITAHADITKDIKINELHLSLLNNHIYLSAIDYYGNFNQFLIDEDLGDELQIVQESLISSSSINDLKPSVKDKILAVAANHGFDQTHLATFYGVFPACELLKLLTLIHSKACEHVNDRIAITISNNKHTLALGYDPAVKKWERIDINQPHLPLTANVEELLVFILFGYYLKEYSKIFTEAICRGFDVSDEKGKSFFQFILQAKYDNESAAKIADMIVHSLAGVVDKSEMIRYAFVTFCCLNMLEFLRLAQHLFASSNQHNAIAKELMSSLALSQPYNTDLIFNLYSTGNTQKELNTFMSELRKDALFKDLTSAEHQAKKQSEDETAYAYLVAQQGDLAKLKELVSLKDEKGECIIDLNAPIHSDQDRVVIMASYLNKFHIIDFLAHLNRTNEQKIDFDVLDKRGNTAAVYAAFKGHVESLKALLKAGVDIYKPNASYVMPITMAKMLSRENVMDFFSAHIKLQRLTREIDEFVSSSTLPTWKSQLFDDFKGSITNAFFADEKTFLQSLAYDEELQKLKLQNSPTNTDGHMRMFKKQLSAEASPKIEMGMSIL